MVTSSPKPPNGAAYDIRKGAAGYATIMGSISALTLPTVIVLFTVAHAEASKNTGAFTLLVGFLVLSLLGCLTSAFAFSAIAGEEHLTPNLPAATMYIGVGVVISITAIIASFSVLAHIYLSTATDLFVLVTAGAGATGAIYNGLSVIDDWEMRLNRPWLGPPSWLRSRADARAWGARLSVIGALPSLIGLALHWCGVRIPITDLSAKIIDGSGIFLTTVVIVGGTIRTLHSDHGQDKGISTREAIGLQAILGVSLLAMLLVLPE
jgi:protein-S-isoprenylcysteine O-methyltransferase Ste14